MNFENLCINCMREKGEYDVVCPHCHFDQNTYEMPPHVLPPYSVLNGRYLTGRVLGSGGFGITYIAMDMILERKVAVKEFFVRGVMYRDSTASDTVSVSTDSMGTEERFYYESRLKFEQEAKILAHLDELPGIVKVFDFFLENDTVYMVQEFLDGITLKKYVENHNGRLPSEQVVQKLASVMESLQQVHEHGILHRDISPDNIMVMEDGSMKLLDFGGAKVNLNHEYSSLVLQKEGYTPIEQRHQDGKQGAWTDVYAMAATMYYCICGIVPVDSVKRSDKDTLKKPSELGVAIAPGVEAAIMKGLALRGQDRYQSMAKFLQALKDGQKKARTPKVSDRKAVIIAAAAVGLGVAAIGAFTVIRSGTPVLTKGGVPEWLDDHTVFTEDTPLVLNGKHLKYVDAVYLNDKKVEDLEIVEQTDKELKLVFSLPEDTERLSLRLEAGSGFLKKKSSEKKIKVYETETQVPKAESLTKNGYELNREELRVNEPFTLGVNCGSDSEDYIFVNGETLPDCTYADGSVSGTVDEELIKKINEEGELRVWLSPKTKEGYAASKRSNEIVLKVNERLIDNSWTELMEGSEWGVKMIVDFDQELENEEAEIQDKIDALYEAGVRFLRYRPANGVDLTTVMEVLAGKKDMYLILDLTGDADMEKVYAAMTKKNREAVGRVIAMIDSGEALDQWVKTNKIQDSLKILFCADNMGMIFKDSLDYWKKNNIKAVSFREDSYWSSTSLRNRENVKKTGIAFFCDSPRNALEAARLLEPSTFGDGQTGVRGILSGEITPDSLYSAKNGKIDSAVLLAGSANGDGVRDYLKMAATSGYTVMAVVKDNGREIDNIAPELEQLGFSSSVLGNAQAGRYSYIGIVKTHTDGSRGDLVYEESRSPADGVPLETDYVSEVSGRSFHLKSMGRRDENDKNGPAAAVITGGENYAPNQSGINFVIYDEQTDTIIDRIWFNTWTNKDNPTPALSKSGGFEWVMFHTPKEQKEQAEKIAKYFETLASKKNEYLIIAAAADDSTRNFGSDIQKAMEEIGVTAAFDNAENFQKSYVGLFAEDLKEISVENGSNDTFSDQRLSVENLSYDGKSFHVVSEGHDIENSLAQIEIDGKEMTNGLRGLHILVYDRTKHCPVNYAWIDGYDGLRFNSIDLG